MKSRFLKYTVPFAFLVLILSGCESFKVNLFQEKGSCETCHTDYATLQQVFTPDDEPPASGCGGDAPVYQPYDRVYMGGEGYEAYKKSGHYDIGCTGCHNGNDKAKDKSQAHSGTFLAYPSSVAEETCATCHSQIVDNFESSLHNGMGQKRKVAIRSGLTGPDDFDQLPAHQIEGYNNNCATCHGTCGNCHVSRPKLGGGGLANGHMFTLKPEMSVCVTCHSSRGGHAFLGVASGTVPDVHQDDLDFKCTTCHDGDELHGDGVKVEQRYAYDKLPECEDCHTGLVDVNPYHSEHYASFNCQVCHSQDYNNCGSCHIHGEGARIPSYIDFKIAVNPIPDIKPGFEFALVRRTLAAPDNWIEYGVDEYSNFDALPTFNYTTPHNILKWTTRTQVDNEKGCYSNCHIRKEGEVLVNKNLYLFLDSLKTWETGATAGITVDGKLPSSWFE